MSYEIEWFYFSKLVFEFIVHCSYTILNKFYPSCNKDLLEPPLPNYYAAAFDIWF
jgi:hypothetical protein